MPEMGFNLESSDKMVVPWPMQKTIDAFNWNYFYIARSFPEVELVQEFYANLTMPDATEVLVRKKEAPLTSNFISDLFNLPKVEEDEYFGKMKNINWDIFQQELNNFMPISYGSTISMERILLLYVIMIERAINVGKIILKEIHDCARNKIRNVYFPSLITPLCLRAKDKTKANLKGPYVQGCITAHDLKSFVPEFPDYIFESWNEEDEDESEDGASKKEDKGDKSNK
ncbi:hypothetical protein PVK06_002295 [Gossypium arboreum]|uniref:Putative plant transposon protein domain-containing protein n=1 Tax=Gossypium arboreum TaxID=29729 RepID=A0ABR0R3C7_GOSAR|nr:hypothetical protein PVK06_002295 [Gossypium arboreum]